jgi:hypothetical protein
MSFVADPDLLILPDDESIANQFIVLFLAYRRQSNSRHETLVIADSKYFSSALLRIASSYGVRLKNVSYALETKISTIYVFPAHGNTSDEIRIRGESGRFKRLNYDRIVWAADAWVNKLIAYENWAENPSEIVFFGFRLKSKVLSDLMPHVFNQVPQYVVSVEEISQVWNEIHSTMYSKHRFSPAFDEQTAVCFLRSWHDPLDTTYAPINDVSYVESICSAIAQPKTWTKVILKKFRTGTSSKIYDQIVEKLRSQGIAVFDWDEYMGVTGIWSFPEIYLFSGNMKNLGGFMVFDGGLNVIMRLSEFTSAKPIELNHHQLNKIFVRHYPRVIVNQKVKYLSKAAELINSKESAELSIDGTPQYLGRLLNHAEGLQTHMRYIESQAEYFKSQAEYFKSQAEYFKSLAEYFEEQNKNLDTRIFRILRRIFRIPGRILRILRRIFRIPGRIFRRAKQKSRP